MKVKHLFSLSHQIVKIYELNAPKVAKMLCELFRLNHYIQGFKVHLPNKDHSCFETVLMFLCLEQLLLCFEQLS